MDISAINNTSSANFAGRKLFEVTLYKKAADGVKKPLQAFVSELTAQDLGRSDLSIPKWGRTKFGKDILKDFGDYYSPLLFDDTSTIIPGIEYRFFATETPLGRKQKAVSIAEVKVLDDFIVLDRLQTLVKGKKAKNRVEGAGSSMLYAVVSLANKLKKKLVSLEAHEKAKGFYKKAGIPLEQRGDCFFYRIYQPQYRDFLEKTGKKLNITSVE